MCVDRIPATMVALVLKKTPLTDACVRLVTMETGVNVSTTNWLDHELNNHQFNNGGIFENTNGISFGIIKCDLNALF